MLFVSTILILNKERQIYKTVSIHDSVYLFPLLKACLNSSRLSLPFPSKSLSLSHWRIWKKKLYYPSYDKTNILACSRDIYFLNSYVFDSEFFDQKFVCHLCFLKQNEYSLYTYHAQKPLFLLNRISTLDQDYYLNKKKCCIFLAPAEGCSIRLQRWDPSANNFLQIQNEQTELKIIFLVQPICFRSVSRHLKKLLNSRTNFRSICH